MAVRRPSGSVPTATSISAAAGGPEPPCRTSSRVSTILTGRPHFWASRAATASPWMTTLPPNAPPHFQRDNLQLRERQPNSMKPMHQLGGELALRGGPDGDEAVRVEDLRHRNLWLEVALVSSVDGDTNLGGDWARPPEQAAASPRAITVREQMLLGARGRGSMPLVKTCSCSTEASGAMAAARSMTAGRGS